MKLPDKALVIAFSTQRRAVLVIVEDKGIVGPALPIFHRLAEPVGGNRTAFHLLRLCHRVRPAPHCQGQIGRIIHKVKVIGVALVVRSAADLVHNAGTGAKKIDDLIPDGIKGNLLTAGQIRHERRAEGVSVYLARAGCHGIAAVPLRRRPIGLIRIIQSAVNAGRICQILRYLHTVFYGQRVFVLIESRGNGFLLQRFRRCLHPRVPLLRCEGGSLAIFEVPAVGIFGEVRRTVVHPVIGNDFCVLIVHIGNSVADDDQILAVIVLHSRIRIQHGSARQNSRVQIGAGNLRRVKCRLDLVQLR